MTLKLDHLVITARTLEEGVRFVVAKFGVDMVPGVRILDAHAQPPAESVGRRAYGSDRHRSGRRARSSH